MSDEFLKIATKEINEDIIELEKTLFSCKNDTDVISNASQFQKYTHKIKGLAPMMGKENLGDLSSSLDSIFKKLLDASKVEGIFNILNDVIPAMKLVMIEPNYDLTEIKQKIFQIEEF
jgi:chemotaxis protein histidine kinase CheA